MDSLKVNIAVYLRQVFVDKVFALFLHGYSCINSAICKNSGFLFFVAHPVWLQFGLYRVGWGSCFIVGNKINCEYYSY